VYSAEFSALRTWKSLKRAERRGIENQEAAVRTTGKEALPANCSHVLYGNPFERIKISNPFAGVVSVPARLVLPSIYAPRRKTYPD